MGTDGKNTSITVGFVQINNSFPGQNYLPLSTGMLQVYVQKHWQEPGSLEFLMPIYHRTPVDEAVHLLRNSQVAFFSTYVCNFRISLEIAKALKLALPDTIIAFGGPHVPNNADGFLKSYPFINVACHGEGEQTSLAILENGMQGDWVKVPGISYLDSSGHFNKTEQAPRMDDLSLVPSPYLDGVFAPLMQAHPEENWIGLWETNRGCPFSCTFCDWGSAVQSKVHSFELERLYQEAEWFAHHKIEYVFCCDANFGILPRDVDIAKHVALVKRKYGYPHALSVQNTKNATDRAYETQRILSEAGLNKGVDIALQSTNLATLKSIKRANISLDTYQELQQRFSTAGVETYTDLILGLPGETYESFADGVPTIIENGQHNRIQFNNLSILPNAEMGDPAYQKKYGMLTVESKSINIHGTLGASSDDIYESQMLVVGTNSLPKPDWVRTRVFSWMAALLPFDKTLQIPLIVLHETCSISYRRLIEAFTSDLGSDFPIFTEIRSLFTGQATNMQNGGPEFTRSDEWLNIWWPTDEYVLIKLCVEDKLVQFYEEAEAVLGQLLKSESKSVPAGLLYQAVEMNRNLLKLPHQNEDLTLELTYNIWEFYQSILVRKPIELKGTVAKYHIDRTSQTWSSWDDWCREVIWYGNKKGAYLYGNDAVEPQLAGHF